MASVTAQAGLSLGYWSSKVGHVVSQLMYQYYCNDSKFSDRYVWANSVDPDQTTPCDQTALLGVAVWSGFTLFAIPSASFGRITLW